VEGGVIDLLSLPSDVRSKVPGRSNFWCDEYAHIACITGGGGGSSTAEYSNRSLRNSRTQP
jgi:hypothetical protein